MFGVCNGVQIARLRQSSAVEPLKFSCVTTSLSIEALIPGIWGQAGPRVVDMMDFCGWDKACGGWKRRLFRGGWAYGMLRNWRTLGVVPFMRPITWTPS